MSKKQLSQSLIQLTVWDSRDGHLTHVLYLQAEIQSAAVSALQATSSIRFHLMSDKWQFNKVVDKYVKAVVSDPNPAAKRGFALALGALHSKLLCKHLDLVCIFSSECRALARVVAVRLLLRCGLLNMRQMMRCNYLHACIHTYIHEHYTGLRGCWHKRILPQVSSR